MTQPQENQTPGALQLGQPFNPFRLFTGIFIPEALVRSSAVSAGAKLAYGRLARYAGQDDRCFPAVETLAQETMPQSVPRNLDVAARAIQILSLRSAHESPLIENQEA